MSTTVRPPAHETLLIGVLLSLVGGFLDAYTYVLKGGVFANAQTGNVVLLAIALLDDHAPAVLKYLFPLSAFVAGIAVAETLRTSRTLGSGRGWVVVVLTLEGLWLTAAGAFGAALSDAVVNCGVSFVAGLQVTSFKKLGTSPYATTMITGNLRSAVELLGQAWRSRDPAALRHALKYVVVIAGFAGGAALGAAACALWGTEAAFAAVAGIAAVLALVAVRR